MFGMSLIADVITWRNSQQPNSIFIAFLLKKSRKPGYIWLFIEFLVSFKQRIY
jgi:hypothetical protein